MMKSVRLPDVLQEAILGFGYETASDFVASFPDPSTLDKLAAKLLSMDSASHLLVDGMDSEHVPAAGRLRRLRERAEELDPSSFGHGLGPHRGAAAEWLDQLPPKLSQEQIKRMTDEFLTNYPSEILPDTCMPGTRLLSQVHAMFRSGGDLRWLPWKSLVSRKQELDQLEARPSKVPRMDFLHAFQAVWDEPPALSDADISGHPYKLMNLFKVRRNAIALCDAAHLQVLCKFDEKFMSYYTVHLPPDSGLRPPNMQEFQAADRHVWTEVFRLVDKNWKLNEALQEFTEHRSDMATYMQPRPKPPPKPILDHLPRPPARPNNANETAQQAMRPPRQQPKGKGRGKGKGADKGKGKGKERIPGNWAREVYDNGAMKPICFRFHLNSCKQNNCRFSHKCPVKDSNGRVCGGDHRGSDHPAAPRT